MPLQPFIGEIAVFGFNFAPRGWAMCNGQLLSISQNAALFSLLGTTFGGNGVTTFALPDLRSRSAVGVGQGPGLSPYDQGEMTGQTSHTLTISEIPNHTHIPNCNSGPGSAAAPGGNVWAADGTHITKAYAAAANLATMTAGALSSTGGSQAHENRQPVIAFNFCIALSGIYPSRN